MLRVLGVRCYFPEKEEDQGSPSQKEVYRYPLDNIIFQETGKAQNRSLKNSVKVSLGTMLCSQEKKSKAEKHPDKSCVNGIRVQCYFTERDHGGDRLEITQSKVASTILRVQSYCLKKG